MPLSDDARARYARHIALKDIGHEGQEKLQQAKVLCVGAGGLGSPAALYLAAAGVGTLGIIDFDTVDVSNLQRQVLFSTDDVGKNKAVSAKTHLEALNPLINVISHSEKLQRDNVLDIIAQYELVVDGSDNYPTRYLVNDASHQLGRPVVSASIFQFSGQLSVFNYQSGPCYRCLYPAPPPDNIIPNCSENGVFGAVTGTLGALQAAEVIKMICGVGEPLSGKVLVLDLLDMHMSRYSFSHSPDCIMCREQRPFDELPFYENTSCNAVPQIAPELLAKFSGTLIDIREPDEIEEHAIPGSVAIPMADMSVEILKQYPGPYLLHCRSGARSTRTATMLREEGMTDVFNLTGGILAWEQLP